MRARLIAILLSATAIVVGQDARASEKLLGEDSIRAAVGKSLPLLEKSARISMEKRKQCFTCHNQALPVMALVTARDRGFAIDAENLRQQLQFTADFLEKNRTNYLAGKGQGGQALTAGYALWTLDLGGWKANETTAAVTDYLLKWQKDLRYWKPQTIRPPSEESLFTTTFVALRGLKSYSTPEQRERWELRSQQVREWMLKTKAQNTEDRVFKLWCLAVAGASAEELNGTIEELWKSQRPDGGWAQLAGMESDAYASATALVALTLAGNIPPAHEGWRKGLGYLLSTQQAEGSWHVKTRSTPIQTYYESGYPHGEDQFISITAAGWATTALALALPKASAQKQ